MPRASNPNIRTLLGSTLIEPATEPERIKSTVITRKFDVSHYEKTGELKYLEEGVIMPSPDAVKNTELMRKELTSIEQFKAIGSYGEVAKKYKVSQSTAHNHMKSLRAKQAREEREMIIPAANNEQIREAEEAQEHPIASTGNPMNLAIESYTHNEHKAEELELHVTELEKQWAKPTTIEDAWGQVENILTDIRVMYLEQAESDYRERLASLYLGKTTC